MEDHPCCHSPRLGQGILPFVPHLLAVFARRPLICAIPIPIKREPPVGCHCHNHVGWTPRWTSRSAGVPMSPGTMPSRAPVPQIDCPAAQACWWRAFSSSASSSYSEAVSARARGPPPLARCRAQQVPPCRRLLIFFSEAAGLTRAELMEHPIAQQLKWETGSGAMRNSKGQRGVAGEGWKRAKKAEEVARKGGQHLWRRQTRGGKDKESKKQ